EPVRIAGLLKRAVRSLQSVASRDEVFLLSAHGRDVPQIIGSVEKLTQAVINLISNSLKFTPKKGLISVGAQIVRNGELPQAIVITVTDSGMGIKATELQQIWDKYKQSGNKSLRGGGGTGLGLYIVKQVVEAHGGEVTVASIEGVGTSMVLKLPVTRAAYDDRVQALAYWKAVTQDRTDFLGEFLDLLVENGIRYAVIGGQGVNAYAEPLVSLDL